MKTPPPPPKELSDGLFIVLIILFSIAAAFKPAPTPAKHDEQGAKTYRI